MRGSPTSTTSADCREAVGIEERRPSVAPFGARVGMRRHVASSPGRPPRCGRTERYLAHAAWGSRQDAGDRRRMARARPGAERWSCRSSRCRQFVATRSRTARPGMSTNRSMARAAPTTTLEWCASRRRLSLGPGLTRRNTLRCGGERGSDRGRHTTHFVDPIKRLIAMHDFRTAVLRTLAMNGREVLDG